jgi:hypothetical protein
MQMLQRIVLRTQRRQLPPKIPKGIVSRVEILPEHKDTYKLNYLKNKTNMLAETKGQDLKNDMHHVHNGTCVACRQTFTC